METTPNGEKRFALLIDADNVSAKYLQPILDELSNHGTVTYKRIYGDWTLASHVKWKKVLLENSITPIQQFGYTQGKNATDSAMIIDAMDILYAGGVEGFCIVSSDSDFTRLAVRLRESGRTVIGMGEKKTPIPFRKACDIFTTLELLIQDRRKQAAEDVTPKADIERAVVDIIVTNQNNGKGTGLGEVGSRLQKRYPDFDVRNYGTNVLSNLLESFASVRIVKTRNNVAVLLAEDAETLAELEGEAPVKVARPRKSASASAAAAPATAAAHAEADNGSDADEAEVETAVADAENGADDEESSNGRKRRKKRRSSRKVRGERDAEAATEDGSEPEAGADAAAEAEPEAAPEAAVEAETAPQVEAEPESETATMADGATEASETAEAPAAKPRRKRRSSRKVSTKAEAEATTEAAPETEAEAAPEPEAETKPEPAKKPRGKSKAKAKPEAAPEEAVAEISPAPASPAPEALASKKDAAESDGDAQSKALGFIRNKLAAAGDEGIPVTNLSKMVRNRFKDFKVRELGFQHLRGYLESLGTVEIKKDGSNFVAFLKK